MSQQAPSDFQGQSTAQAAPQVPRAGAPLAEEQISSSPDESLRELAARANAAVDKGMKQLSQQEGVRAGPRRVAATAAVVATPPTSNHALPYLVHPLSLPLHSSRRHGQLGRGKLVGA